VPISLPIVAARNEIEIWLDFGRESCTKWNIAGGLGWPPHAFLEIDVSMQVSAFEKVAKSEASARQYLLQNCLRDHDIECPSCGAHRIYVIEGGKRRRCARCGNSFSPFAGRWLADLKIPADKWLWIIKFFELEMPATTISRETGISYPTVLKAIDVTQRAIAGKRATGSQHALAAFPHLDSAVIAVSHIAQGAVQTFMAVPTDLITLAMSFSMGALVWADRSLTCDTVLCCGKELKLVDRGDRVPHRRVFLDGMEGFWPFARERVIKHTSFAEPKLPLYLMELEFRFLHRDTQLFDILVERLCSCKG
jgi:transposase